MSLSTRTHGPAWDLVTETLDALPEGVAVYDPMGGLLLWNSRYAELYALPPDFLHEGLGFEAVLRKVAESGRVPEAAGREEAWVADWMVRHDNGSIGEHYMDDGRWIRVERRRSRSGYIVGVSVDVTELRQRESSFRLLFDANPVPILVYDRAGRVTAANDAVLHLFRYDRELFLGLSAADLCAERRVDWPADDAPWRCVTAHGTSIDVMACARAFVHEEKPAVIVALIDMTAHLRGEEELRTARAFLDSVVDAIPSIIVAKDMTSEGRYVLANAAAAVQSGRSRTDMLGRTDDEIFGPELAAFLGERDREVMGSGLPQTCEFPLSVAAAGRRLYRSRKVPIATPDGSPPRFVLAIADDITDQRRIERQLARAARHDDLTGLPNRAYFVELLTRALATRGRHPSGPALLLVDLDQFRVLNDSLGHGVGDAMLGAVGRRLAGEMRGADVLARLGGDEFVVIQASSGDGEEARALAARLLAAFQRPFTVDKQDLMIGATIGIAVCGGDEEEPDVVLRHAELALQHAKATHRGASFLYEPHMDAKVRARRATEQDLRGALDRDEFELFFQPQVDIATERVTGFEALIRWRHPGRGLVEPGSFIGVAEETGLIVPLGAWVLKRACAEAAAWPVPLRVAVNLSPVQFTTPSLPEAVAQALGSSGLPPDRLELEITESVRLIDSDTNLAILHRFRDLGIHVALDDFGTGFASLSYLRAFPFDRIKIDRSFVQGLGRDAGCRAIVRAAIRLARDLGIEPVAEGIETRMQLRQLRQLGCRVGQGYLFGVPGAAVVAETMEPRPALRAV